MSGDALDTDRPGGRAGNDTIDAVLTAAAAAHPDREAVIDPEHRLTYGELDTATAELAAGLVAAGIGTGTRVGLLAPNNTGWVRTAIALTRIGAVLVPLSTLLTPPELLAQLRTAGVHVLITAEEFRGHRYLDDLRAALNSPLTAPILHPDVPALRTVLTTGDAAALRGDATAAAVARALAAAVTPADPLTILFTSGSRGTPKGVIHAHGSALGAVRAGLADRCITAETRLYLPMPFFWVGGLGGGVLSALLAGATLVTEEIPHPATTLRLLERERVTLFRGWPDQAQALAREADAIGAELSALRPGSLEALLPPALRAEPGARANLFGMTESFGPYCGYPADTDLPERARGSCGRPFPGTEVSIDAPASGEIGEILIRGPHILRGLCGRTREQLFTPDGFYRTGDLGRLDEAGFLFYHGRTDDMVKVSGATVYPGEVERALRSLPAVDRAYVTDLPGPRLAAAVVCPPDTTADELHTATRGVLSAFKVPAIWLLLDSDDLVPRGGTGKVDLPALRALLDARGTTARNSR
ncbi:class I adenylate-forming enzyme family protein [Nocardia asteroides]|uniref:class I adenylate-forming enzyme family protein n=1 Tax=Nocardia asteroides TaxID=1824 RepID=UPI001E31BC8C|nr:class I adenylate-forming enzyme family protein [Nocardia asteroides]UGT62533.1 acyl--CoA ligase [Nocardia asteroides]